MKRRLVEIQNFFLTLGILIIHPIKTADIVLQYRNCEDLKKDIDAINKERIESLYSFEKDVDLDIKKKNIAE